MSFGVGRHLRHNVVGYVALFVALGGASYAAVGVPRNSVGTKQIKKNAVTGAKVKNHSLTGADIKLSRLGVVPSARNATHAVSADSATTAGSAGGAPPTGVAGGALSGSYPNPSLAAAEPWHEVGTPGQVPFKNNNCANDDNVQTETVAFYKDAVGVVHLKGTYSCPTGAVTNIVFHLPQGYRPAPLNILRLPIACRCASGPPAYTPVDTGQIEIYGGGFDPGVDGGIRLITSETPAGSPVSLDGVTFRADG